MYLLNKIHLITLGVKDISKSLIFYRDGLGFSTSVTEESPNIVFFQSGGTRLALYPLDRLAEDVNEESPPVGSGFSGIVLAYVARSLAEVDELLQRAEQAGGVIEKKPQRVFWGGYSGYFSDPDGYHWEVAFWEQWEFDKQEMVVV